MNDSHPAPALSILLPVFDGARFLPEQLDSILAQTDGDFELIAIDDGSRDDSAAILADYTVRDPRIRVLAAQGNVGQALRLRQLLGAAVGSFVAIADQDDVWDIDRNRRLRAAIGDTAVAFGPSQLIDASGSSLGRTLLDTLGLTPDPESRARTLFRPLVSAHAALVRRDWLDPSIFVHPLPFDWLMSALALHSAGPDAGGIVYVPDAVVNHRIHGGNQMNRAAPDTTRRLGALRNRLVAATRAPDQLRLWLMLDFLGRSPIAPERRRAFVGLAQACRLAWYGRPRVHFDDQALRNQLVETIEPLASSTEDWHAARDAIDLVTRSILHPAKGLAVLRSGLARPR